VLLCFHTDKEYVDVMFIYGLRSGNVTAVSVNNKRWFPNTVTAAVVGTYSMCGIMYFVFSVQVLKMCGLMVDVGKSYVTQQR
jgi:hypothetical protein